MHLNTTFTALSDPTRRAIVEQLALGEATVSELAKPHNLSQPTISKHLRVLEKAGLIETSRNAQMRPRRLVAGGLEQVDEWLASLRKQWESRLDRLEDFISEDNK